MGINALYERKVAQTERRDFLLCRKFVSDERNAIVANAGCRALGPCLEGVINLNVRNITAKKAVLFYTVGVETLGCHCLAELTQLMFLIKNGLSVPHICV